MECVLDRRQPLREQQLPLPLDVAPKAATVDKEVLRGSSRQTSKALEETAPSNQPLHRSA